MIEIREVEDEDFAKINLRPYEKETMEAFHARLHQLVNVATLGPAYSFIYRDRVLAIAGIAMLWGKVGEAWLLSSTDMGEHGLIAGRAVIKKLRQVEKEMGDRLQRLQAQAPVSYTVAHRWIKWLGLEYESTAKKYTALGEDAHIFAKVK